MVVRFHLKADMMLVIIFDHTGVVVENRHAPGFIEAVGCFRYRRFQKIIDDLRLGPAFFGFTVANNAAKSFMVAMFAPGLGDRFQFAVRRITALPAGRQANLSKIPLDRLHFV